MSWCLCSCSASHDGDARTELSVQEDVVSPEIRLDSSGCIPEAPAPKAGAKAEADAEGEKLVASEACAPCPVCDKQFRPRNGNAYESVVKHLRSVQDDLHRATIKMLDASKKKCPVCLVTVGSAAQIMEHMLAGPCAQACREKAGEQAPEPAASKSKKEGGGKGAVAEEAKALYSAAKGNDLQTVRRILDKAASSDGGAKKLVNMKHDDGYTALMTAAEAGHAEVVQALLEAGAEGAQKNSYGQTAVHLATLHRREEAVAELVSPKHGSPQAIVSAEHQGTTALTLAARQGDLPIVSTLLEAKSDVNQGSDMSPLMVATVGGHTELVQLLAPKSDTLRADKDGKTALYLAVTSPSPQAKVVEALVANSPASELRREWALPADEGKKATLAALAKQGGHVEIAKLVTPKPKASCQCVIS